MNAWDAFWVGIAPDHRPAAVAAVLLFAGAGLLRVRRGGPATGAPGNGPVERWAAALLGVSAAVHLALPLGHNDSGVLTAGFLGSGMAYAWLALRALDGRRWRLPTALLVVATLVGYLWVTLAGGEEPDQVGLATALVELTAFGLAVVPAAARRLRRAAGAVATVAATVVVGAAMWAGAFAAHETGDVTVASAAAPASPSPDRSEHDTAA
jgi:hypothetical protein